MSQALDWGSWRSLTRTRIYSIGRVEVRIAREGARRSNLRRLREKCITSGSPLCRGLTRATYILCIERLRASATQKQRSAHAINASQSGIEPGTSCTAGEHSMQRAIRTALLTAIQNLGLYYYNFLLKGPKREIFFAGICTEIRPIWVGDLETRPRNLKILCLGPYMTLYFLGFLF
jgi:hypothetical protein